MKTKLILAAFICQLLIIDISCKEKNLLQDKTEINSFTTFKQQIQSVVEILINCYLYIFNNIFLVELEIFFNVILPILGLLLILVYLGFFKKENNLKDMGHLFKSEENEYNEEDELIKKSLRNTF